MLWKGGVARWPRLYLHLRLSIPCHQSTTRRPSDASNDIEIHPVPCITKPLHTRASSEDLDYTPIPSSHYITKNSPNIIDTSKFTQTDTIPNSPLFLHFTSSDQIILLSTHREISIRSIPHQVLVWFTALWFLFSFLWWRLRYLFCFLTLVYVSGGMQDSTIGWIEGCMHGMDK